MAGRESSRLPLVQPQANLRSNEKREGVACRKTVSSPSAAWPSAPASRSPRSASTRRKGLLQALRTSGNQRRFLRSDIRRVSFILIAQKLGLALSEIETQLAQLPQGRAPTLTDWQQISRRMRFEIDQRINLLSRTRNQLDQCIGCGCLSLQKCQLYNKDDRLGRQGRGPAGDPGLAQRLKPLRLATGPTPGVRSRNTMRPFDRS